MKNFRTINIIAGWVIFAVAAFVLSLHHRTYRQFLGLW